MGISVQTVGVREPDDFETAFKAMNDDMPDAILMVTDSLTNLNRKQIFEYAAEHRLPAIYEFDALARDDENQYLATTAAGAMLNR